MGKNDPKWPDSSVRLTVFQESESLALNRSKAPSTKCLAKT